jgi:hypothetical protein
LGALIVAGDEGVLELGLLLGFGSLDIFNVQEISKIDGSGEDSHLDHIQQSLPIYESLADGVGVRPGIVPVLRFHDNLWF